MKFFWIKPSGQTFQMVDIPPWHVFASTVYAIDRSVFFAGVKCRDVNKQWTNDENLLLSLFMMIAYIEVQGMHVCLFVVARETYSGC